MLENVFYQFSYFSDGFQKMSQTNPQFISALAWFTNSLDLLKDIYNVRNIVKLQKLNGLIYKIARLAVFFNKILG
jgi:hypothetical protein